MKRTLTFVILLGASSTLTAMHRVPYPIPYPQDASVRQTDSSADSSADTSPSPIVQKAIEIALGERAIAALGQHTEQEPVADSDSVSSFELENGASEEDWQSYAEFFAEHDE